MIPTFGCIVKISKTRSVDNRRSSSTTGIFDVIDGGLRPREVWAVSLDDLRSLEACQTRGFLDFRRYERGTTAPLRASTRITFRLARYWRGRRQFLLELLQLRFDRVFCWLWSMFRPHDGHTESCFNPVEKSVESLGCTQK